MHVNHWLLAIVIGVLPVLLGEVLYRLHLVRHAEASRKLVHVLGAVAACFFVALLPLKQVFVLSLGFAVLLFLVRLSGQAKSLYGVPRHSYGEVLFPVGIAGSALIANSTKAYLAGVLIMGLADAAASLVGGRYPLKKYLLLRHHKSWGGSLAFALVAIICIVALGQYSILSIAALVLAVTVIEACTTTGLDNLFLPIAATALFRLFG